MTTAKQPLKSLINQRLLMRLAISEESCNSISEELYEVVRIYLAKTIEVRRLRYRDMDTDQQYFLAFHVKCDVCGAGVAEDCRNLRKPGSYNEKPHYDRLVSGYQATHFRQIAGLGYPDD